MGAIKQYDIDFAGSETPALDDVLKKGSVVYDGMIKFHDTTSGADTTIEAGGIEHSYSVGETHTQTNLGNGSLTMADTDNNKMASTFIGTEHLSLSSFDQNTGDPINHFSMEWSEVPGVDMSDDLKEAWRTALDVKDGASIQVTALPTADATQEGKIYQYVGATTADLTKGYFYECVEVAPATDPKTYEWKKKNVQDGGGSGGGNADLTLDTANDFAVIQSQTQGMSFDLSDADGVTVIASDPGTYQNTKKLATQDYVDSKAGVHIAVDKETWYGTYTDENDVTYQVYTKTVYIPALPSTAGITTYPIGVSGMKQIISISGVTTDGFVLNAPRQTASDNISIYQVSKAAQTFSIEVGKDRSNKSAYVTIVYAKNN